MQLKVMFSASGKAALCGQVLPLSSERTILPSPKPNALLSRCESMYGPAGAMRYQKCSVEAVSEGEAFSLEISGSRKLPRVPAVAPTKWRRLREGRVDMVWVRIRCVSAVSSEREENGARSASRRCELRA